MAVQIEVRGCGGERMTIDLCDTEEQLNSITVLQLKRKIRESFPGYSSYSEEDFRLVFGAHYTLHDDRLLSDYGITQLSRIHVILRFRGGGSGPPPPEGDRGLGGKDSKRQSMENLREDFNSPDSFTLN